jgi:alpha-glucosidase (family GH31 glycosyl hydrolase)
MEHVLPDSAHPRQRTETEIWNWLPATQTNLMAFDQLRYRMLPYNYSVAWKITSESYTPMRALVMDFPKDTNALPDPTNTCLARRFW